MRDLTIVINPLEIKGTFCQAIIMKINVKDGATESEICKEIVDNLDYEIVGETSIEEKT